MAQTVQSIFSSDALTELGIDFEPPLPPSDRFFELDEDEIIEIRDTPIGQYTYSCQDHIPRLRKATDKGIQREQEKLARKITTKKRVASNIIRIKIQSKTDASKFYICDLCGVQFKLRASIKTHFRIHMDELKTCTVCDSKFTRQKTLDRHIFVMHNKGSKELKAFGNDFQSVNCLVCDRLFESINNLRIHEANHLNTTATCHTCGFICKSQKILTKHERKHLNIKYPCEICGAQLNSADSLRGHLKYMHTETKYRCGICGVEYRHRGNYNDHIAGHLDPESKICEICNFEWDSRRSCLEHKRKKHPGIKLDYSLPKVDPTNLEVMEMLRKLIDALPRHNGKPNHLEVSMKSVGISMNVSGMKEIKEKLITKAKGRKQKKLKLEEQEDMTPDKNKSPEPYVTHSDIKEQKPKKADAAKTIKRIERETDEIGKSEETTEGHILSHSYQLNSTRSSLSFENPKTNFIKPEINEHHDLMSYDEVFDYSQSPDIFETKLQDIEIEYKEEAVEDESIKAEIHVDENILKEEPLEQLIHLNVAKRNSSKATHSKDALCRICNQFSPNIKVHLKFYHSDCVLDRICRICQKIAMCKRDLKEHIKVVHKKQFPAYQLEIMQKKHPLHTNLPRELYCIYCPAKFLEQDHLTFHLEVMHSDINDLNLTPKLLGVECKLCGKSFPSQDTSFLKKHINSNHGHSIADCICFLCGTTFVVKNYLKIHLDRHHTGIDVDTYKQQCSNKIQKFKLENPEYPCDSCNHYYVDLEDLNYHREVMHQARVPINISSDTDPATNNNVIEAGSLLLTEDFDYGEIVEYKCDICGKMFSKKDAFEAHLEQHAFGLLFCQECEKHFTGVAQKREHDAYKHGIGRKSFVCDLCGEKVARKKALVAHFQLKCPGFTERPQMKWKCMALKQKNRQDRQLKDVMNGELSMDDVKKEKNFPFSHGTEKKMCDLCGKICCNDYRLMEHGRRVHGVIFSQYEELYKQDQQRTVCECGKVFFQLGPYYEHRKVHTQQLISCKTCGIIVKGKKTLARHELLHKPKSFSCDICGMKFHQKRTMTVHKEEKHSLSRYICKYCQQEFKYGATYREHLKGHEVPNFLRCEICNKDYASRSCLRTHRKRTHPEIYGDQGPKSRHQRPQSWSQYVMQSQNPTSIQIQFGAEETVTLMEDEENMD